MEVNLPTVSNTTNSQTFTFGAEAANVKMSKHQPIDIKPQLYNRWLLNGLNNSIYQRYKDAYDDSPTNASIINAFVNYIFGDGLVNTKDKLGTAEELEINKKKLEKYISEEDVLLICQDYKTYGGYSVQVIFSYDKVPLRIEYIPIYKLGIHFRPGTIEIDGYWFCWDWANRMRYTPQFYPKFSGSYTDGQNLEIMVIRRPTAEPFFCVPDYFSGIPWAEVEGDLANGAKSHFQNTFGALTIINYNNGKMASDELAKKEAKDVRDRYCGSDNNAKVIVSFNEGPETAVTVDQLSPPELNQQNVFYSEEAERKLKVAHSAPPILFAGSTGGGGFSSNADEMAVATKIMYRKQINPSRKVICKGLQDIFDMIPDTDIKLDLFDFKEENQLDNNTAT